MGGQAPWRQGREGRCSHQAMGVGGGGGEESGLPGWERRLEARGWRNAKVSRIRLAGATKTA